MQIVFRQNGLQLSVDGAEIFDKQLQWKVFSPHQVMQFKQTLGTVIFLKSCHHLVFLRCHVTLPFNSFCWNSFCVLVLPADLISWTNSKTFCNYKSFRWWNIWKWGPSVEILDSPFHWRHSVFIFHTEIKWLWAGVATMQCNTSNNSNSERYRRRILITTIDQTHSVLALPPCLCLCLAC